jgi:hypothetical protein
MRIGGASLSGLHTSERLTSMGMKNAKMKEGGWSLRKNYIRIRLIGKDRGLLKLVTDHRITRVYFEEPED